jgi:hypothetical protein
VDVVHPLSRNSSRGGLLVLSSFSRRSPHEGLLCWASVVGLPLGRSWAVEGAQEQVDRDTLVSRTPTVAPGSPARKRALFLGVKGQGPTEAARPSNGTRQRARLEDHVKMQSCRHVAQLQLARQSSVEIMRRARSNGRFEPSHQRRRLGNRALSAFFKP